MKKTLLLVVILALGLAAYSQKRAAVKPELRSISKELVKTTPADGSELLTNKALPLKEKSILDESTVGVTKYDKQTNRSLNNRMYYFDDGTAGITWTMGLDEVGGFTDRGTGYNYFDGTAWGPQPSVRIDPEKCGWPTYSALGENGEVVVSHNAVDRCWVLTRSDKGTGTWNSTYIQGPTSNPKITWPRVCASGVDQNIIHVLAIIREEYNGQGTPAAYYRSPDGGATWDILSQVLDPIGPSNYTEHGADGQAWAEPYGDNIAFLMVSPWMDLVLMKSPDNGDTWNKTVIWLHPYPMFNWDLTFTTDTLWAPDNSGDLSFDNNGMIHVVFGLTRVAHTEAGTTYSYWPYTDGIVYWNEDMPQFEDPNGNPHDALDAETVLIEDVNLIGWTQDVNNSGAIEFEEELYSYPSLGISTMPSITIDELNRIVVLFASTTETYTNGTLNFKHIWSRGSPDKGVTWGDFVDISGDLIHLFDECIYPVFAKNSDDNVHFFYNTDATPGNAVDGDHAYQDNFQVYGKWDKDLLIGKDEHTLGSALEVTSNYPNPCNDVTYFNISLQTRQNVVIDVTNLVGSVVLTENRGSYQAGSHLIKLNTANLKPGVYFCTVTAGDSKVTRKMIVE